MNSLLPFLSTVLATKWLFSRVPPPDDQRVNGRALLHHAPRAGSGKRRLLVAQVFLRLFQAVPILAVVSVQDVFSETVAHDSSAGEIKHILSCFWITRSFVRQTRHHGKLTVASLSDNFYWFIWTRTDLYKSRCWPCHISQYAFIHVYSAFTVFVLDGILIPSRTE